jgi:hypothetical protein
MNIDFHYQYTQPEIPPRCRKERLVRRNAVVRLRLRTPTLREAPVAIIEHGHHINAKGDWAPYRKTYRVFRGHFFTMRRDRNGKPEGLHLPRPNEHDYSGYLTRAERLAQIRAWGRRHIVLRGRIWEQVGEPRYVAQTFGLGCNHGGTALLTSNSYNGNISRDAYYRIDQLAIAIKEAERIAKARGDTKNIPIRPNTRFDVRLPGVLRLNPRRQHGKGNPFLNKVERAIQTTRSPAASGLLVMAMALAERP